jgi:molybdate transport system substrate-binding protein
MQRRSIVSGIAASIVAMAGGLRRPARAEGKDIIIFAAASLKNALDDINEAWRRGSGKGVTVSYAASSTLAKQIENGAPADLFISADTDWMDYLETR